MVRIDTKFSKPHASSQQKKKKKKKSPNKSASFVMHPQHTTEEFCAVSITSAKSDLHCSKCQACCLKVGTINNKIG